MDKRVWVCEQLMKYEGGSTDAVCATYDDALQWLTIQHERAERDAVQMNEHIRAKHRRHEWTVSPITEEGDRAEFEDNLYAWRVRPMDFWRAATDTGEG